MSGSRPVGRPPLHKKWVKIGYLALPEDTARVLSVYCQAVNKKRLEVAREILCQALSHEGGKGGEFITAKRLSDVSQQLIRFAGEKYAETERVATILVRHYDPGYSKPPREILAMAVADFNRGQRTWSDGDRSLTFGDNTGEYEIIRALSFYIQVRTLLDMKATLMAKLANPPKDEDALEEPPVPETAPNSGAGDNDED